MLDGLTITQTLSFFFGLYFLSAGIGMMLDREAIPKMFDAFTENPAIGFLAGLMTLAIGAVVISIHSNNAGVLATIITFFGWVALAEGMLMLAFRRQFLGLFSFMSKSQNIIKGFSVLAIAMGVAFILAGLQGL